MKLASFSVSNYRSITRAHRLPVSDATILVGPNNEGKSNLLSALAAAMEVVSLLGDRPIVAGRIRLGPRRSRLYDWPRDFPIQLQDAHPDGESVFRLEFSLTEAERADFYTEVRSTLNENLPIEIRIGKGDPSFTVIKQGPGSTTLNKKGKQVASFIGQRIEVQYIPAVRTAGEAIDVVHSVVSRELLKLDGEPAYQAAMRNIEQLQQPILNSISQRISGALKEFLPNVRGVRVSVSAEERYHALRRAVDITVDDGTPTQLERKGDGVQSLAAISLLRGLTPTGRHVIMALEEPESHLHPGAIHRLRFVIDELAQKHQVVITTHCPAFVDRVHVGRNILVQSQRATPARSVAQVRDALGVRASDNLLHAYLVLVVEGESDRVALTTLLAHYSGLLRTALAANTLVVEHLHGASKASYKVGELVSSLCNVHCFLDHDDAGRSAGKSLEAEHLLTPAQVQYATCPGMKDSELEDLLDVRA